MFEGVSVFARKRLLIGIILMCGLLSVYEYYTVGFVNIGVFRVFLPVFWVAFSIVVMFAMGTNPEKVVDRYYQRKNRLIVSICNTVTLVMIGYVYFTFSKTGMDVDYWSSKSVYTTLIICILVLFYMIGAFKDFKVGLNNMIKYPYPTPNVTEDLTGCKACDISDVKKDTKETAKDKSETSKETDNKPLSESEIDALRVLNSGDKYAKEMNKCLGRKAGFMVTPVVLDDDAEEDVKEEKAEETATGDELMDAIMEDAVVKEEKENVTAEEKSEVSSDDTEEEDETETTALDDAE